MTPEKFRDRAPKIARAFFLGFGIFYLAVGCMLGLRGLLMAWLGASLLLMGLAYTRRSSRLLGKRTDGSFQYFAMLVHAIFFAVAWVAWKNRRIEDAWNEVVPGIFVGRMTTFEKLPPGEPLIIDMTCELFPPPKVRGPRYRCLPTLDGTAPEATAFRALVKEAAAYPGPVFACCAAGHGRSATMAAAVIVARGLARTADQAEAMMQSKRPRIGLGADQRLLVSSLATESAP